MSGYLLFRLFKRIKISPNKNQEHLHLSYRSFPNIYTSLYPHHQPNPLPSTYSDALRIISTIYCTCLCRQQSLQYGFGITYPLFSNKERQSGVIYNFPTTTQFNVSCPQPDINYFEVRLGRRWAAAIVEVCGGHCRIFSFQFFNRPTARIVSCILKCKDITIKKPWHIFIGQGFKSFKFSVSIQGKIHE